MSAIAGRRAAVGPRSGLFNLNSLSPAAAYALFDRPRGELTFFRVPYNQMAAAQKIRAAGLPLDLARRVEVGI